MVVPYYRRLAGPVTDSDRTQARRANALFGAHRDDPEFGYRFLLDEAATVEETMAARTAWRICSETSEAVDLGGQAPGLVEPIRQTTRHQAGPPGPVRDDLVQRDFTAKRVNELWLTDISEHPTSERKLHLCAIKDVAPHRIVGYSIGSQMTSRLAAAALEPTVARRRAEGAEVLGCVVHSDRGSHFRSRKVVRALNAHGLVGSMGKDGACGDNAAMESSSRCCRRTSSTATAGPLVSSCGSRS